MSKLRGSTKSRMCRQIYCKNSKEYEKAHDSENDLCSIRFIAAMIIMVTVMALAALLITSA
jgi:hypothetical protein